MEKATLRLLLVASGVYYAIIFFALSILPSEFTPRLYFLVAPLIGLVVIIVRDLSSRATVPSESQAVAPPGQRFSREIQQLTRQIEVGTSSSSSYFESVLLSRLREVLVQKVALETGWDSARVRDILADPKRGPGVLRNDQLYRLLYSRPVAKGSDRVMMLEEAVALIEAWKP